MDFTFQVFNNTRAIFSNIIDTHSLEDLNTIPNGFNNNIIWNIAHVIVSEQLLVYKLSGLKPLVSDDIINTYRKDTKPSSVVTQNQIEKIKRLLITTISKTKEDYIKGVFKEFNPYTVSTTGNTLNNVEEALQFAVIHEALHYGYILALLKAIKTQ